MLHRNHAEAMKRPIETKYKDGGSDANNKTSACGRAGRRLSDSGAGGRAGTGGFQHRVERADRGRPQGGQGGAEFGAGRQDAQGTPGRVQEEVRCRARVRRRTYAPGGAAGDTRGRDRRAQLRHDRRRAVHSRPRPLRQGHAGADQTAADTSRREKPGGVEEGQTMVHRRSGCVSAAHR